MPEETTAALSEEDAREAIKQRTLKITITTEPGRLLGARALGHFLANFEKLMNAVAKSQGVPTRGKNRLLVDVSDVELFPHKGGIKVEVTLLIHSAGDKLAIKWQTDEQMQDQIEAWKRRRKEDEKKQ